MGYIDLTCRESISLMNGGQDFAYENDAGNKLFLGYNVNTYLFFELPPIAFYCHILQARLLLYKIPLYCTGIASELPNSQYSVCPLLDFFSSYSNLYTQPRTDDSFIVNFEDQTNMSYTEIDITAIAGAWIEENIENKGLLMTGNLGAQQLIYASDQYKTVGMRPMLRLTYDVISWPLRAASCTVAVEEINRLL